MIIVAYSFFDGEAYNCFEFQGQFSKSEFEEFKSTLKGRIEWSKDGKEFYVYEEEDEETGFLPMNDSFHVYKIYEVK